MKKGLIIFIGVIFLIILSINAIGSKSFSEISENEVDYICVRMVPKASEETEIRDKSQIEEIVKILNSIITKKSNRKNNEKGWEIMMTFSTANKTYNISILQNKVICNGYVYNISSDDIDKLKELIALS